MISFARTTRTASRPPFVVDPGSIDRDTGRQIDWDLLTDAYSHGATPITANGAAAAAATAITVDALPIAIPQGTVLNFQGSGEFALVTADVDAGATSIPVEALDAGVEDNDVAYVDSTPHVTGRQVKAGTVMDLLANGKIAPSALATGGVTAYGILETNADEDSRSDAATGYGVICAGFLYENLLPEATGSPAVIDSTWKTELRARGGAFRFDQYGDDSAT